MSTEIPVDRLRAALLEIAEVARKAAGDGRAPVGGGPDGGPTTAQHFCNLKSLPKKLQLKAAQTATKVNPVNRPAAGRLFSVAPQADLRLAIAVLTTKYWGPSALRLTVSFLDNPPADLRARILSHMNAWNRSANVQFVETARDGQVRISRGAGGYWSYLGTDILHIPLNRQTMNLEGFTMNTPDSEFYRVVRHETGHTLGFPHEHMRKDLVALIDPEKAYDYFGRTQGWNREEVDQQVLTSLDDMSIIGTPADQTSIMCYQLPGTITRTGEPIPGGLDINQTDYDFAGRIYPKTTPQPGAALEEEEEFIESPVL